MFFQCLLFLPNVPGATFIQGATFIPESRVHTFCLHSEPKLRIALQFGNGWGKERPVGP